jgi:hypothetical protein
VDPPIAENVLEACVSIIAPPSLQLRLAAVTTAATSSMPHGLLRGTKSLTRFDSRGLEGLRQIGNTCFGNCSELTRIDGTGFCSVEAIGYAFAHNCVSLAEVHLPHMPHLRTIHAFFLSQCHSLVSFDTKGLGSVTSISGHFMTHCAALTTFDAAGLTSVVEIGDRFLANASSLVSFDGDGLTSLETIGHGCLPCRWNATGAAGRPWPPPGQPAGQVQSDGASCRAFWLVVFRASLRRSALRFAAKTVASNPM